MISSANTQPIEVHMSIRKSWALLAAVLVTGAALGANLTFTPDAHAADHTEAPGAAADPAADIADLYAWHNANSLITVVTFAGLQAPAMDQTGTYDPDVLYTIHIDHNGDNVSDFQVHTRFGQNALGDWGMQVSNLPGEAGPLVGPVETVNNGAAAKAWSGLADDPFFFDLQGFNDTVATGTLSFDPTRDSLAGTNVTAIVLEMPLAAATAGSANIQVWATTSRF